jgi:hypothetical protein
MTYWVWCTNDVWWLWLWTQASELYKELWNQESNNNRNITLSENFDNIKAKINAEKKIRRILKNEVSTYF